MELTSREPRAVLFMLFQPHLLVVLAEIRQRLHPPGGIFGLKEFRYFDRQSRGITGSFGVHNLCAEQQDKTEHMNQSELKKFGQHLMGPPLYLYTDTDSPLEGHHTRRSAKAIPE